MAEGTRAWFSERRNLSKRSEVANRERRAFFNTKSELQLVRESLRELSQLDASPPACARARRVIRMQANARPWTETSPVPGCETPFPCGGPQGARKPPPQPRNWRA